MLRRRSRVLRTLRADSGARSGGSRLHLQSGRGLRPVLRRLRRAQVETRDRRARLVVYCISLIYVLDGTGPRHQGQGAAGDVPWLAFNQCYQILRQ